MSRPQANGDAMLATLADNIVLRQAPGIARDAEGLVSSAAWPDFIDGLAVIDCPRGTAAMFAMGSGHNLARALGSRFRPAAVVVGVAAVLRAAVAARGLDDPEQVVADVAADIEAAVIHEAAHAAVAPLDDPADEAALARVRAIAATPSGWSPEAWCAAHGPAWAVAYAVLADRALRYRPHSAPVLRWIIDIDLEQHGVNPRGIAAAVAGFPADAPLRGLDDRELFARAAAAMLPDAERVAAVNRIMAGQRAAPGGAVNLTTKGSVLHGGCPGDVAAAHGEAA